MPQPPGRKHRCHIGKGQPNLARIVRRGAAVSPAFLGDPLQRPSQSACLIETQATLATLAQKGELRPVDLEAAARMRNGPTPNAALWVAASEDLQDRLPKAVAAFKTLAFGFLAP